MHYYTNYVKNLRYLRNTLDSVSQTFFSPAPPPPCPQIASNLPSPPWIVSYQFLMNCKGGKLQFLFIYDKYILPALFKKYPKCQKTSFLYYRHISPIAWSQNSFSAHSRRFSFGLFQGIMYRKSLYFLLKSENPSEKVLAQNMKYVIISDKTSLNFIVIYLQEITINTQSTIFK